MAFMEGVGPCGHVAKEKGILVKVFTSCLANEIPAELAFSMYCVNNMSTGTVFYTTGFHIREIDDGQHPCGLDFTRVRCKKKIDQPCTMAPVSTWEQWYTAKRSLKSEEKIKADQHGTLSYLMTILKKLSMKH